VVEGGLLNPLKKLGLTEYEAKAYQALTELGEAEALEISRRSGVPRTRIYDILSRLEAQGLIQRIKGARPALYSPLPPQKALKALRDELVGDLDRALEKVQEIYENRSPMALKEVWLLRGAQTYSAAMELLKEAEKSVLVRMVFLPPQILEEIWSNLREASRRGVEIYLILDTRLLTKLMSRDELMNLANEFKAKILDSLIPFNVIVADFKKALTIYTSIKHLETCFGFLIHELGELGKLVEMHLKELYGRA